jgi:alpha-L-rhamnosidase
MPPQGGEMEIFMKKAVNQNEITTEYLLPERIVLFRDAEITDVLLREQPRQAFLGDLPVCTLKKSGYVLLDFGEEFQGGADITIQQIENTAAKLRIVFGESVSEALSEIGIKNATNDHSPRDITVTAGFFSHLSLGNTGYRFLKLEALNCEIKISSVQGISRFRNLEYKGSFSCSDTMLNKIWEVGARTVHLNMQEYIWDGIKRDRLVWIGDMHPETSTISMVFGETPTVKKSLDSVRDCTPGGIRMNGLHSYSMWWIKIQRDLYWDSGNLEYLKEQAECLVSILKDTLNHISADGECDTEDKFVEWSSKDTPDEEAGFYSMLITGLESGAEILNILNSSKELAEKCRTAAELIKKRSFVSVKNKQIAAMTGLCGINDLKYVCENILKPGGAAGLSTFWGYYVLLALAEAGETDFALDIIRRYWGAMINLGATTFWEDFDIGWIENSSRIDEPVPAGKNDVHGDFGKFCYKQFRHSLCHGWASGPTSFLSRQILGIKAVKPGYKEIRIEPDLGSLTYAGGSVPTPFGIITVKHTVSGGKIKTDISVPDGIKIIK